MKNLPTEIDEIISLLKPYTSRAYLVGGASRDIFMGNQPEDFDIEVYDISPSLFEKIMKKIGAKGVGKEFFVYKYKQFDLSLPRKENKVGKGHRGFEVSITQNEKIASMRRDFSINSIMINIFNGEVVDCWNGVEDIKSKILRVIDKEKFKEDSLRVLRAMQFSSRFGFRVEEESLKICKEIDLSDLSLDRIYKEFEKMFLSRYLFYGYYYFIKMDIDLKLFKRKFSFFPLAFKFRRNPHIAYFLYHLTNEYKIDISFFPKKIRRVALMKKKSKVVTNRFLYALSLKYPLKEWSILNNNCCKNWLIEENLYNKKYKPQKVDKKNPKLSILREIKEKKGYRVD